jgi:hypothetical protein|nr:MAG TPA: hypothetical protein [Caudoviricetes sp.]
MKLTDELIKDFLQYLYHNNYRYLFTGTYSNEPLVSQSKPLFSKGRGIENMMIYDRLNGYAGKLGKEILNKEGNCIDIAKKLNIVDWSTVKVDTKIMVKDRENDTWRRRYFAYYKNGEVYVYCNGKTSWSASGNDCLDTTSYKLAEVVDE